jgi:hypothetical protein
MLYSAVRFLGKSNLRNFEVEAHFLLEARKNLVYMAVVAFSQGLPWLGSWFFRCVSGSWFRRQLGPPTPRPAFEDMAVVEEAVEHGGDGGAVTE